MSSLKLNLGEYASGFIQGTVNLTIMGNDELILSSTDSHMSLSSLHRVSGVQIDTDQTNTEVSIPASWLRENGLLDGLVAIDLDSEQTTINGLLAPSVDALSRHVPGGLHHHSLFADLAQRSGGKKIHLYTESLDHIVRLVKRRSDWCLSLIVGKPKREFTIGNGRLSTGDIVEVASVERLIPIPARVAGPAEKTWLTLRADLLTQVFRDLVHVFDPHDVVSLHLPPAHTSGNILITCGARQEFIASVGSVPDAHRDEILSSVVQQMDRY